MKRKVLSVAVALVATSSTAKAQSVAVPKTNPKPVYVHYMPWFETPATLGGTNWGYHWKMNTRNPNIIGSDGKRQIASYYYPTIGPYASRDKDVLEYHFLLMKLSGIDGVIMDWYGTQGSNGDIPSLLTNSNAVADTIGNYGMKFSVMLEDQFGRTIADPKANVAYLRDNYFNKPSYLRTGPGNKPLLTMFGPQKFQTPAQWTEILAQAGEDVEALPLWYESGDLGANADGEFAWIYQDKGTTNHLSHQQSFLASRSNTVKTAVGVAYPGFEDYYAAGGAGAGIGFTILPNGGNTLSQTLALNTTYAANTDMVQLATWNDFGEGTMLEPTLETGFTYLRQIQQFTGVPYDETQLNMVLSLYNGRKNLATEAPAQFQLNRAATALNGLNFVTAADGLRLATKTAQIDRLFKQTAGNITTASAPFDFNGDGKIVSAIGAANSDSDYWVRVLNSTQYGDATIDGHVNFDDLVPLAQNYNRTNRVYGWADGSFNGDGIVNFDDLVFLAQNYESSSALLTSSFGSDFAKDFAFAQMLVPEPATLTFVVGVAACGLCRRSSARTRHHCGVRW